MEVGARIAESRFKRNIYVPYYNVDYIRHQYNNTAVHTSTWAYSDINDIDNSRLYGNFYMDFDNKDDFELVRQDVTKVIALFKVTFSLKEDDIKIYFSGSKGVHLIISAITLGIEPSKDLHMVFKYIAKYINSFLPNKTIDLQVYNRRSMLRMPNSKHEVSNLYKIQLTHTELNTLTHQGIKELAIENRTIDDISPSINQMAKNRFEELKSKSEEQLKRSQIKKFDKKLDVDPLCIQTILSSSAPQGTRNHVVALLSSHFKARGYDSEEALKRLLIWNDEHCSPKMKRVEIKTTLSSIYSGNKNYGCSSLSLHGECNKEKCKLYNKKGGT